MKSDSPCDGKVEVSDEVTKCNQNTDELLHDGDLQLVSSQQEMNIEKCNTTVLKYNGQATSLNSTGENVEVCLLASDPSDVCETSIINDNNIHIL